MNTCLLCQIVEKEVNPPGEILFQNEELILCHALDINIFGYLLLFPKRHVDAIYELNSLEINNISIMKLLVTQFLKKHIPSIEKFYICSFGEITSHVHFHIFPRYDWMLKEKDMDCEQSIDAAMLFSRVRKRYQGNMDDNMIHKIEAMKPCLHAYLNQHALF